MVLDAETGQWEGEGVGASCVGAADGTVPLRTPADLLHGKSGPG